MKVRAFDKPQILRIVGRKGEKWRVGWDGWGFVVFTLKNR